jgi:ribosomal protein S18 acetylase RimI-like enzyme
MSMNALDNIFWNALAGAQAKFSAGTGGARRYAKGFSPLLAFADPANPDWAALVPYCEAGEQFYCADWDGAVPAGWRKELEATMYRMVWGGAAPPPVEDLAAVRLGGGHVAQAMELATLARPGPFGPRTIELGEYFGVFEGSRLVAMAGERMHTEGLREISGVCTHPDFRGRGLARKLMVKLMHRQLARGETPFLHVMCANTAAHDLYLDMGFRDWRTGVVRVMALDA